MPPISICHITHLKKNQNTLSHTILTYLDLYSAHTYWRANLEKQHQRLTHSTSYSHLTIGAPPRRGVENVQMRFEQSQNARSDCDTKQQ